jgi:Family of unknown function (DUF5989)
MKKRSGFFSEFWRFIRSQKAYWMVPIVIVLGLLVGLVVVGGTGAAPFIYSLF